MMYVPRHISLLVGRQVKLQRSWEFPWCQANSSAPAVQCAVSKNAQPRVYIAKSHGGMVACMVRAFDTLSESKKTLQKHVRKLQTETEWGRELWQRLLPGTAVILCRCAFCISSSQNLLSTCFREGAAWLPAIWQMQAAIFQAPHSVTRETRQCSYSNRRPCCYCSCIQAVHSHELTAESWYHFATVSWSQGKRPHQRLARTWTSTDPSGLKDLRCFELPKADWNWLKEAIGQVVCSCSLPRFHN